jgi:hypothetical protein
LIHGTTGKIGPPKENGAIMSGKAELIDDCVCQAESEDKSEINERVACEDVKAEQYG